MLTRDVLAVGAVVAGAGVLGAGAEVVSDGSGLLGAGSGLLGARSGLGSGVPGGLLLCAGAVVLAGAVVTGLAVLAGAVVTGAGLGGGVVLVATATGDTGAGTTAGYVAGTDTGVRLAAGRGRPGEDRGLA